MTTNDLRKTLDCLRQVLSPDDLTDERLLKAFIAERDESAFAALVRRHGPMVLGVCRRVLGNPHDSDDAFQATFFVLAQKARSVSNRQALGAWLYTVAYRIALEAKAVSARRRQRERQVAEMPHPEATLPDPKDWRPLLDYELSRLPEKYRTAVILCDLEGRARKEVAGHLGLPEGTLSSRLAYARRLLAARLSRHGLNVSAGALALAMSQALASACVPPSLATCTVNGAVLVAVGRLAAVSAPVAVLMKGALKAMFMAKLKATMATFLVLAVLGAGTVLYSLAGQSGAANATPPSDLEALRKENDLLKLNLRIALEKIQALEAELAATKSRARFSFVDLQPKANQKLTDDLGSGIEGNNLASLPKMEQTFEGVKFKIMDGFLQLGSARLKEAKPNRVDGIPVGKAFTKLHILHATNGGKVGSGDVADDTEVAQYLVHYKDGQTAAIPVIYGKDVRDWWDWANPRGTTRGKVVWKGENDWSRRLERKLAFGLYLSTWENPHPSKEVVSIDYVKVGDTLAAPFCVALTLEEK